MRKIFIQENIFLDLEVENLFYIQKIYNSILIGNNLFKNIES
jgi:hypothetical protein